MTAWDFNDKIYNKHTISHDDYDDYDEIDVQGRWEEVDSITPGLDFDQMALHYGRRVDATILKRWSFRRNVTEIKISYTNHSNGPRLHSERGPITTLTRCAPH